MLSNLGAPSPRASSARMRAHEIRPERSKRWVPCFHEGRAQAPTRRHLVCEALECILEGRTLSACTAQAPNMVCRGLTSVRRPKQYLTRLCTERMDAWLGSARYSS